MQKESSDNNRMQKFRIFADLQDERNKKKSCIGSGTPYSCVRPEFFY